MFAIAIKSPNFAEFSFSQHRFLSLYVFVNPYVTVIGRIAKILEKKSTL